MFNNFNYQPQGPAFQRPAYQQMPMQQIYPQQPMMQDGMLQARFVSGREEAVASNVMPGSMFLFCDRAHGMVYSKLIDPQTGMPDFRCYAEVPQAAPSPMQTQQQYVTVEMFNAMQADFERRLEALGKGMSKDDG